MRKGQDPGVPCSEQMIHLGESPGDLEGKSQTWRRSSLVLNFVLYGPPIKRQRRHRDRSKERPSVQTLPLSLSLPSKSPVPCRTGLAHPLTLPSPNPSAGGKVGPVSGDRSSGWSERRRVGRVGSFLLHLY